MGSICIAYHAFFGQFQRFYPDLEMVDLKKLASGKYDLVIFSGGEDINPRLYRQENKYSYYNDNRDEKEIEVYNTISQFNRYNSKKIKMLGVCRGHQLINALRGGRLAQDILFDLKEDHPSWHGFSNKSSSSSILRFFPNQVNSMHHQAVVEAGKDLNITSIVTTKGSRIIESTESDTCISVQWHPEFMGDKSIPFFEWIKQWATPEGAKTVSTKPVTRKRNLAQLLEEAEKLTKSATEASEEPSAQGAVAEEPPRDRTTFTNPFVNAVSGRRVAWHTSADTSDTSTAGGNR